jgi:hypothetical protein
MISKDKTYRTRDGREVRIYATDGSIPFIIHGAWRIGTNWISCGWLDDGSHPDNRYLDLIEVNPRIKRTVWIDVMRGYEAITYVMGHPRHSVLEPPLARVKVEIDCEEGEGL